MKSDPDYDWLMGHLPHQELLPTRAKLATRVSEHLESRLRAGALPYTLGVFGGWGSGKTTFLSMLANRLQQSRACRIVYFNSWKYAGFMEIVPSLIYKILKFGLADTEENRDKAAMRVLLSLGKEYSDRFGRWAAERVGVDPVGLFKDVYKLGETVKKGYTTAKPELLSAYYGQVDKAQDALVDALGQVGGENPPGNPIIVLIDELDRCDPDEAFNVIKQMRVLFAMRRLPVAFVVCANPEPIGLAIKHRYGLESASGDYEARRILEKFVDAYEDLSEPSPIGDLVRRIWKDVDPAVRPWVLSVDEANGDAGYAQDTIRNATAFDAMTTIIPQYSNLRVLRKSFEYVSARANWNQSLLWTIWHLEIVSQIDPEFRQQIRTLSSAIGQMAQTAYNQFGKIGYRSHSNSGKRLIYETDKGGTLFAVFRSLFWEAGRALLTATRTEGDPQSRERAEALDELLSSSRRMDFVIILSLLPFTTAPGFQELSGRQQANLPTLSAELEDSLRRQFGWLLANY